MDRAVVAANVARLRTERDISQEQLAQRSGISRITLGKIERGDVVPRSETLADLARGLRVSVDELVTPVRHLSGVRFRAKSRVNGREQILARVASWLEAYSELEDCLSERREFTLSSLVGTDRDPVHLAFRTRERMGLGDESIRDIRGLFEHHGIKVLSLAKSTDSFFGLSVSPEGGGPAVVVNTWDRISVERWIFTAAHELGHILLHQSAYDRSRDDEERSEEREADRFASHFLMPERTFASEWDDTRGHSLLTRTLKVKRIFSVSYKTILTRLIESGRETEDVWKAFQIQHKRAFGGTLRKADEPERLHESEFDWNRAGEPEGLSACDFVGDRLYRLVRLAVEREAISLARAGEILGLKRSKLRELVTGWEV